MSNRIVHLATHDVRFPTSDTLDGSDATNHDPDYSAAYVELVTEQSDKGYGLIFTIGRGNDLCCEAIKTMRHLCIGWDLGEIQRDIGAFYNHFKSDSQLRWLGPEKGVVHMALGAVVNAVWDMWARKVSKPVWRLIADLPAEQFVDCLDYSYVTDVLNRDEALDMVNALAPTKAARIAALERSGYPAYTTSAGWLGYSDEKLRRLCLEARWQGFRHIKLKVGMDLRDDIRRCAIVRETLGDDIVLMLDANQAWEVDEAIGWMRELEVFSPWFIEEPTSPDDILGHRKIKRALRHVQVATGEHCQNRVIFKQLIAQDAVDIVQIDACRLGGLNEILTIYMLAAKYGKIVCPHAGGVGLCEYVQHYSMIDYLCISGHIGDRVIEYVDHLHEHFEDPCELRNGRYLAPSQPGFSIKMYPESITDYSYPGGVKWHGRRTTHASLD